ncbi:MAG: hypothetical protein ACR2PI_22225 [Hyphomicrobiaceae bacterium]
MQLVLLEGFEEVPQITLGSAFAGIAEIHSDDNKIRKAGEVDGAVIVDDPARELSDHDAPKMRRILVFAIDDTIDLPNALPIRQPSE